MMTTGEGGLVVLSCGEREREDSHSTLSRNMVNYRPGVRWLPRSVSGVRVARRNSMDRP